MWVVSPPIIINQPSEAQDFSSVFGRVDFVQDAVHIQVSQPEMLLRGSVHIMMNVYTFIYIHLCILYKYYIYTYLFIVYIYIYIYTWPGEQGSSFCSPPLLTYWKWLRGGLRPWYDLTASTKLVDTCIFRYIIWSCKWQVSTWYIGYHL